MQIRIIPARTAFVALASLAVAVLVALLAGVEEAARVRILGESRGNPLYLTEFARRPGARAPTSRSPSRS